MPGPQELLRQRLAPAFEEVAGRPVDPAVGRSQDADYQSDAALALARTLGTDPRTIAARVVSQARLADVCSKVEISGPGFINLVVADATLASLLDEVAADDRLGVPRDDVPEV